MLQAQTASPLASPLFVMPIIFAIFYFLVFKPQKDQEKKHQQMLNNLVKNDEVVTTGGIHGTIVGVKDKSVILRVDDNVKIEVERNCISFRKKQQQGEKQG
jgi:preprotein translocase subunit YajC